MERAFFRNIVHGVIITQIFLTSTCVGASPCRPKSDPLGRYTISGGSSNIWSHGTPSGSAVHVSVRCDPGSTAQPSVTSQCRDGTWDPSWPHCEKPCLVPTNQGEVRQFVNGSSTRPVTQYSSTTLLPDGTELVARCRDPGKHRLVGDLRRTCHGGQWTGEEPQCQPVETKVLFYGAKRQVASNGTVVVHVYRTQPRGNPKHLYVVCKITRSGLRPPRLTTPLVNDRELKHWHYWYSHRKVLDPIRTEYSGVYTCSGSSASHSVHVVFKAAECEAPGEPEHGRYVEQPPNIIQHDTTVSFVCDDDYRLVGSYSITCHKGEWEQDPPVCKVYKCPELSIPDNAVMEGVYGYGRSIGDERIFYCRNGYVLRGDTNNLRCLEGGVWSAPLPTCEAVVHHVSPCEGVRCASWERCVVTGSNSWVCGCINPSSCLTSGPTVCGTNGRYYSSECHLKAFACLMDIELDVAENDHGCIYGVPEEDRRPTQQATVDEIPQHLSSSSSFEEYEGVRGVENPPSDAPVAEETDPLDYLSFESLDSSSSSFDISIEETSHSTPTPSTPTQSTPRAFTSESGEGGAETTPSTPVNSTLAQSTPKVLNPDDVGAVTTPSVPANSTLAQSTPKLLSPDDVGAETPPSTPVNATLVRSTPRVLSSEDVDAETTQLTPAKSTLARSTPKTFNSAEGVNGTLELNPVNSTRSRPISNGPSPE